ncbi:hypothetical protein DET57_11093 [Klebsiella oxytoca]|uniref:DUF1795 domain-containing protein n=1 Tax=Klebsiella oxytoca TaxID=571 RepID=A0A318FT87_KLEOX|nr:hypothetical protein DET57_11093 [Klebsiella oxytoca]
MKYRLLVSAMLVCSTFALSACDSSSNSAADVNSTKILDGKATIVLPEGYKKMPEEMLVKKYTLEAQRPKEVWYVESEGGKVTMAFSMTANPMKESQLAEFAGMMKKQFGSFSPEVSAVTVNGKKMQRLQMTTPDADDAEGGIYNLMQISSLDNKLLITTFNSTADLKDKYSAAGVEALSSLKY